MIIKDLLEDPQIQSSGAKYYPDLSDLESYFLVRRHGTQEFINARRRIIMNMPPIECMVNPDIQEREQEILRRLITEYYVCGMSGISDEDTGKPLSYNKNIGVAIFHSDAGIRHVDGVINTAMNHNVFMSNSRNKKLKAIKDYVKCEFDSPTAQDKEDDLLLNHMGSTESYNNSKVKIDEAEAEIITAFYDSCKYRKENQYLSSPQINEGYELHVTMTNHYDYVEIIKELDTFYIGLKVEKERLEAKARKNDN